ncbi:MAG: Transcriptional activator protein LuxR [Candidatus Celerinatantimonas neptuna]|nr:MAG: Transcriptional activator protein LuxR [Candidatus Celerinatantimonas neptuna]
MIDTEHQLLLLDRIRSVKNIHEFSKSCIEMIQALECDFYLFRLFKPSEATHFQLFLDSNYPQYWLDEYLSCGFDNPDPVLQFCRDHQSPVFWHQLYRDISPRSQTARFFKNAAKAGLIDGVSVPIHGTFGEFGILSLTMKHFIELESRLNLKLQAQLFAPYLQEAVNRFWRKFHIDYQLTARERECLSWACQGKTTWEIAQILHLAESTVNFHLNNTITKTKASNRQQAIAKALMSGVLMSEPVDESLPNEN